MHTRTVSFVAALAILPLFGLGCNPFASPQQNIQNSIGQTVANSFLNQTTGGKVQLNENSNSLSFTDNTNGGTMAFGDNVTIPSDFPKEVPIYPGAKAIGVVMSRTGDKSSSLTLRTDDDVAKVIAWYADHASGWKQESSYTANKTELRSYTSDSARLSLTVSPDDSTGKGSIISIVFTPNPS